MRRLSTPAWLLRHAVAAALIVGFLGLGWWQANRAAGGNTLSWAYAVEWPIFAGFVFFLWWREVRHTVAGQVTREPAAADSLQHGGPVRRPVRAGRPALPEPDIDPELAAYNHYLAWLNANPGARPGDYPGWSAGKED